MRDAGYSIGCEYECEYELLALVIEEIEGVVAIAFMAASWAMARHSSSDYSEGEISSAAS